MKRYSLNRGLKILDKEMGGGFFIKTMSTFSDSTRHQGFGMRYELPIGSIVTILHYNFKADGPGTFRVQHNNKVYTVEARMNEDFTEFSEPHQPVDTYVKGKLYRYKSDKSRNLICDKGKHIGTVKPGDPLMFLEYAKWENARPTSGYFFKVIHQDLVGWVGSHDWSTLEEIDIP